MCRPIVRLNAIMQKISVRECAVAARLRLHGAAYFSSLIGLF